MILLLALLRGTDGFLASGHATTPGRHAAPVMMSDANAEKRLLTFSNRAIKRGALDDAQRAYEVAISNYGSGESYLLAALHHRRTGRIDEARGTFSAGILQHRNDGRLMQAWGLFESKYGHMDRAVRLLRRAVYLDPSLSGVLRWRIFQTHQPVGARRQHAGRPMGLQARAHVQRVPAAAMASVAQEMHGFMVQLPAVRYTVPIQNLGWRGRPERGEDPQLWYDAEGLRNGPPMNYWRQAADERFHRNNLAAVDAVARGDEAAEALVAQLENRMPILRPQQCRKLLGRWAPVLVNGARLGEPLEGGGALQVPLTMEVRRAGERQTMTNRYGEFDAHMEDGEELTLALEAGDERAEASLLASADNSRRDVAFPVNSMLPALGIGRVTFLSDYMLAQRDEVGTLVDVWVRVTEDAA